MVQNTSRHPRRSDQEWIALIHECRSSGMSDKAWCEMQGIHPSNFYYHIRRLRAKACELPPANHTAERHPEQQVVEIQMESLSESPASRNTVPTAQTKHVSDASAIRISIGGYQVDISNSADSTIIYNTLAALHSLC